MDHELMRAGAAAITGAAALVVVGGVVQALAAGSRAGSVFLAHSSFALQLLLAAGLLRLSVVDTWTQIAIVATVIAIRQVIVRGLRLGAMAWR